MIRFPLAALAALTALGLVAGCGSSTPAGRAGGSGPTPRPSTSAKPGTKVTPSSTTTTKPASAAAGFASWAQAAVDLTGGGPDALPVSSMPAAERDIMLIDHGLHFPGWERSIGQGLPLREIPSGCEASILSVVGEFAAPANSPVVAGASKIALVVRFHGACTTESAGKKYLTDTATGSLSTGTWVLLGSMVALPPVAGLPSLPTTVWAPVYRSSCTSGWVQYAGSLVVGGAVPGC